MDNEIKDKMLGCLYGQAIGDALGLGAEFMSKDDVIRNYPNGWRYYDQIIQDAHRRRWLKGAWSDDTDMMLCILNGYEDGELNLHRIASNFKDWFNGAPMGIGSHTFKVLSMDDYVDDPEMSSKVWWDLSRHQNAANGAIMRTSVVGLVQNNVEKQSADICRLTHYDPRCVGSCVIVSSVIHNLVWHGIRLSHNDIKDISDRYDSRIAEWVDAAFNNSDITLLHLDDHKSLGYTLRTLSAALWCYWHSPSFEDGLISVVNEGGDADTNAAVACAVLGAKYGYASIPRYYVDNLRDNEAYHDKLLSFVSQNISNGVTKDKNALL